MIEVLPQPRTTGFPRVERDGVRFATIVPAIPRLRHQKLRAVPRGRPGEDATFAGLDKQQVKAGGSDEQNGDEISKDPEQGP